MGHALKINGVNFSGVSLGTVTYIESNPCTAISFDVDSLSFTRVEETKTITATLTPEDTTDVLFWSSSNENVATVADGVVTIHGIGSATITATCGEITESLTITQTTIKAQYDFAKISGYYPETYTVGDNSIIRTTSSSSNNCCGQAKHSGNTDLRIRTSLDLEAIRVPYGATKLYFAAAENTNPEAKMSIFGNTNSIITYDGVDYPEYLKQVTSIYANNGTAVEYGQCFVLRFVNADFPNVGDYAYFT